jgi:formate hydrogenlyase subunit 3/multisubunit Na+/H+ antiporter MnhD subunit
MEVNKPRRRRINRFVIIFLLITLLILLGVGIYYSSESTLTPQEPDPSATEDVYEEDH